MQADLGWQSFKRWQLISILGGFHAIEEQPSLLTWSGLVVCLEIYSDNDISTK